VRVTSRARQNLGAVELLLAEDDISDGRHTRVWPVHVDDAARVYEITGPHAWTHLVDAYPLAAPASRRSDWYEEATGKHLQWYLPDWAAVSVDYDAVHLTVLGYLTTAGLALPLTTHTGASFLAGWIPTLPSGSTRAWSESTADPSNGAARKTPLGRRCL
jgi:hypothetical protein